MPPTNCILILEICWKWIEERSSDLKFETSFLKCFRHCSLFNTKFLDLTVSLYKTPVQLQKYSTTIYSNFQIILHQRYVSQESFVKIFLEATNIQGMFPIYEKTFLSKLIFKPCLTHSLPKINFLDLSINQFISWKLLTKFSLTSSIMQIIFKLFHSKGKQI